MGQSCSNVQPITSRQYFLLDSQNNNRISTASTIIEDQIAQQLQKQYQYYKSITYLPTKQQIIYVFKDSQQQTVQNLQTKRIYLQEKYQNMEIVQILNDRLFVAKIKEQGRKKMFYKLFCIFDLQNTQNKRFFQFGLFYYNFNKIKHIKQLNTKFIHADACTIHHQVISEDKQQQINFIIQSQSFEQRIVSLKQLGKFMKANDINWKDNQFLKIILQCLYCLNDMHKKGFFMFQDFFIDRTSQIWCFGGIVGNLTFNQQKARKDYYLLVIYLIQTLYGVNVKVTSRQELLTVIQSQQKEVKFNHNLSIQVLIKVFDEGYKIETIQYANLIINDSQTHIDHYVGSYLAKRSLQPTLDLGQKYIQLGFYSKAKQILFEKLSTLLYKQKIQKNKYNSNKYYSLLFSLPSKNRKFRFEHIQQTFQMLEKIIQLERKINQFSDQTQLSFIINQYINVALTFSISLIKRANSLKALVILERTIRFITQDNLTWLLALYIAQVYFIVGNLNQAQKYFKKSIQLEISQANMCFFVNFYSSVLNWEKSIALIRSYEGLIIEQYIYEFFISKSLLAKALCHSGQAQKNQDQLKNNFRACVNVIKRVFDRKGVPDIILMNSYQVLADAYFYLMNYQQARINYQKCLVLVKSLAYKNKLDLQNNNASDYQTSLIRTSEEQVTKTLYPKQYQSFLSNPGSTDKKSLQQSFNIQSIISSANTKQYEYVYQAEKFFDVEKQSVILSSLANTYFMQKKYNEALLFYEQARNQIMNNSNLKDSIVGNMAICFIQMSKESKNFEERNNKISQGKQLLSHIINTIKQSDFSKLENDINYKFLLQQLEAISTNEIK